MAVLKNDMGHIWIFFLLHLWINIIFEYAKKKGLHCAVDLVASGGQREQQREWVRTKTGSGEDAFFS